MCLDHETLLDHVEGRLTPEKTEAVLTHLDQCSACRRLAAETVLASAFDRAVPAAAELPSRTLDRYLLLGQVGSGAMGVVYAAYDPTLDRKVALKLLRAEVSAEDLRSRLLREAQAMARLHHPNVITVFDVGTFGGRVFIAMEFIDGTTLSAWLEERPRTWREVLEVMIAAGRGLAAAHQSDLVHRDFKPDNVLVSRDGRVCVTDFGLARLGVGGGAAPAPVASVAADSKISPVAATLTRSGTLLGTPAYMAPEQMRGEPVSASADVFSFCVAFYEALFGVRPFAGDTLSELERAIAAAQLVERDSPAPTWLRKLVKRGLAADAGQRPPSMTELVRELERDRSARRRGWLALAGACVLVGGAALALRPQPDLCRGAGRKLVGVWDDAARQRVAAAFASDKLRGEASSFERALDGYTRDWVTMHTSACEATRRRGEQSEELLDLRMACLDDRLRHVHALADLVSRGAPDTLAGATKAALSLPPLAECANMVALRAEKQPPPAQPRVAEIRAQLAEAEQRLAIGSFSEGMQIAEAALSGARAIGYELAIAEGLLNLGRLQSRAGKYDAAAATLRDGVAAAEAAHSDRLLARVAMALAYQGYGLGQNDEGTRWNRLTAAAIGRLGGDEGLEADRLRLDAILLHAARRQKDARPIAERALALTERIYGREDLRAGQARHLLGSIAVDEARYDEAIAQFTVARGIYEAKLGANSDFMSLLLRSLSGAYYYQQRYEDSLVIERQALAIAEARLGPEHLDVGETASNVGMVLLRLRRYREAIPLFERALAIYEKVMPADAEDRPVPMAMMGEAYAGLEQWKPALEWLERAVAHPKYTVEIFGEEAATTRLALARGLWATGRRPRALALAKQTRAECEGNDLKCADLVAWSEERRIN